MTVKTQIKLNKLDRLPNPANKAPWKDRRKEYQEAVDKLEKDKSEYIKSREEIFANLAVNPEVTLEIGAYKKRGTNFKKYFGSNPKSILSKS